MKLCKIYAILIDNIRFRVVKFWIRGCSLLLPPFFFVFFGKMYCFGCYICYIIGEQFNKGNKLKTINNIKIVAYPEKAIAHFMENGKTRKEVLEDYTMELLEDCEKWLNDQPENEAHDGEFSLSDDSLDSYM